MSKKTLKPLELSPESFDISLHLYQPFEQENDGCDTYETGAVVAYKFGEEQHSHCFSREEAEAVGNWFLKLSKAPEGKVKKV